MTEALEVFPQHAATEQRGRLSIADILERAPNADQALVLVKLAHPNATSEEVAAAVKERVRSLRQTGETLRAEADAMERVESVVARDGQRTDGTPLGESLKRLVAQGDKEAAAIMEHLNHPVRLAEAIWLDRAVALDPYWERTGEGRYRRKKGALHDTPEKLITAYLDRRQEAAFDDLPADLRKEVRELLARATIEQMVTEHLDELVSKGELERHTDERGQEFYQRVQGSK